MQSDDPMFELVRSYLDIPGVVAAILVSDQGLVINSAQADVVDIDTISALLVDMVSTGQRFGRETGAGGLETMTVEFDSLTLLVAPFHEDVMLALVGRPGTFALQ